MFGKGADEEQDAQIKAFIAAELGPENEEDINKFLGGSADF